MYKRASRYLTFRTEKTKIFNEVLENISNKPNYGNLNIIKKVPLYLNHAFKHGKTVEGIFKEKNKGGYVVDFNGFQAFCPYSEMYPQFEKPANDISLYMKKFNFIVKNIDSDSVVVSRRRAAKIECKDKIIQAIKHNDHIDGVVTNVKPYGAFVDLGGIDGLLHISEISGKWIDDIHKMLKKGMKVKVKISKFDEQAEKVSLTMNL